MAILVLTDALVEINSVDLSDHVEKVTLEYGADMVEATAMGDDTHDNLPGLKNWGLTVEFQQDFASAKVDATLFPLVGAAAFAIEVRPVNAARSATNPGYTGQALVESYPPLGNKVGELAKTTAVFKPGGTLSRTTSST